MSVRIKLWLGVMVCTALVLAVAGGLTQLLVSWLAAGAGTTVPALGLPLLVAGLLALVLFAPLAWLLAWTAYEPVRDVTRTAHRIVVDGQLDGRCFYPGPLDDIGRLVVVMNEVLVRYDAALARVIRLRAAAAAAEAPHPTSPQDAADLVLEFEQPGPAAATPGRSAEGES